MKRSSDHGDGVGKRARKMVDVEKEFDHDVANDNPTSTLFSLSREQKSKLNVRSVLRIEIVRVRKNYHKPWRPSTQATCHGSGFVISYECQGQPKLGVLTNAHVVSEAVLVHIVKAGSTKRQRAKVIDGGVSVDLDLALLTVNDVSFWDDMTPLCLSPRLPSLFSDVMVVGFPAGGKQVCLTKGIVSRITTAPFAIDGFPSPEMLAIQIDAAVNPGNSGGPALSPVGNVCFGVAALKDSSSHVDNIGYIIPSLTVLNFLSDVQEHGRFCGVIDPGFYWAPLENKEARKRLSLAVDSNNGVLVSSVKTFSHAAKKIKVGDVLLEVDHHVVASDGNVGVLDDVDLVVRPTLRIESNRHKSNIIELKVLRKTKDIEREQRQTIKLDEQAHQTTAMKSAMNPPMATAAGGDQGAVRGAGGVTGGGQGQGGEYDVGALVNFKPQVHWRWEKDLKSSQTKTDRVLVVKKNQPSKGLPVVTYDVLNEITNTVTNGVPAVQLEKLEEWDPHTPDRMEITVRLVCEPFPVLCSVRQHQLGASLSYFMIGGLVFINHVWCKEIGKNTRYYPPPPIRWFPRVRDDDQQVILVEIFQHECNYGYTIPTHGGQLKYVNGQHIRNLAQLKRVCLKVKTGFLEFETSSSSGSVVLNVDQGRSAQAELLSLCNMQSCCSFDLADDTADAVKPPMAESGV